MTLRGVPVRCTLLVHRSTIHGIAVAQPWLFECQRAAPFSCGDRHWLYVSVDPTTGVREFSCGPTSDKHAGGFSEELRSDMHRYLKVVGGFCSVSAEQNEGAAIAKFRHHAVDGLLLNEVVIKQEE